MTRVGIGVLCKPPRPGLSKTRLAAAVGPARAAALAAAFLADTAAMLVEVCAATSAVLHAFYRPADAAAEVRPVFPAGTPLAPQPDADLGEVMLDALARMRRTCPAGALVVGTDAPTLPAAVVAAAVAALRRPGTGAVFGPALDGGYYLAGIADMGAAPLFAPMRWSTAEVMAETRRRADRLGLAVVELTPWYDVDDGDGLALLRADIAGRGHAARLGVEPGPAPATRAVLARRDA